MMLFRSKIQDKIKLKIVTVAVYLYKLMNVLVYNQEKHIKSNYKIKLSLFFFLIIKLGLNSYFLVFSFYICYGSFLSLFC